MNDEKKTRSEWSDEDLMTAYKGGDEEAFGVLYRRYSGKIYSYLRAKVGIDAKANEVFQEIFLKLHRMRSKYRSPSPFSPWLYALMRNTLIDCMRKERTPAESAELDDIPALESHSSSHSLQGVPGFVSLSPEQKQVLNLRYVEDRSFSEIGVRMVRTEPNIRKILSRALSKLRRVDRGSGGA